MAATTVIGAFEPEAVREVVNELLKAGFERRELEILEGDEDQVASEIADLGFGREDARELARAVADGKALLAAKGAGDRLDRAASIMERFEEDEGGEEERAGSSAKASDRGGEAVPVVEERLKLGKRRVVRGGVRVTSHVVERPVEETVTLREETVEADRRKVDRVLSPEEAKAAFEERTVEMTETAEELQVDKEARVVEEVSLEKRAEERERTVRDKVRRTEVEVEDLGSGKARKGR